jgi:proteic killer suppression protein
MPLDERQAALYMGYVIRTFKNRGLKALWERDDRSKVDARLADRILRRLDALNAAIRPDGVALPGFDFHPLTGKRRGTYAVSVSGPWRITFEWDGMDAVRVDLEQYH